MFSSGTIRFNIGWGFPLHIPESNQAVFLRTLNKLPSTPRNRSRNSRIFRSITRSRRSGVSAAMLLKHQSTCNTTSWEEWPSKLRRYRYHSQFNNVMSASSDVPLATFVTAQTASATISASISLYFVII